MRLFRRIPRYDNPINEELKVTWEAAKPIKNTQSVRYVGDSGPPAVVKKMKSSNDFIKHILFYRKIQRRKIKTPRIFSQDHRNSIVKYQAIGTEHGEEEIWAKTLVNFRFDPDKEAAIVDFLIRAIDYALKNRWADLYSGNILFDDGYLYLIDYVPGLGNHKVGTLGLEKISGDQKANLVREKFDCILEMALNKFPEGKVSHCGLDFLRSTDPADSSE